MSIDMFTSAAFDDLFSGLIMAHCFLSQIGKITAAQVPLLKVSCMLSGNLGHMRGPWTSR